MTGTGAAELFENNKRKTKGWNIGNRMKPRGVFFSFSSPLGWEGTRDQGHEVVRRAWLDSWWRMFAYAACRPGMGCVQPYHGQLWW